ncbi:hypothetical protein BDF21DRAFT_418534 [Thamnidium elegans]|nr:hypothetical protein BDF21DRAFT_418534 [Thamnidium elegans]
MNSTSNYCLDSISRRSSLCPPHHDSDPVLSPPLTPAMSQHHPFDKRQSTDLSSYSSNHYNTRPAYSIDSYHHWMNHSATIQHMQQQQQQVHHPMHQQQQQQQNIQQQQQVHPIPPQNQPQRSLMTDRAACSTRKQPSKQNKHMCNFPECLWSFKRYEHLKRHMLVHTGERPHVCPHPGCGKRFSRSDNFHAHYRTHEKKAFARQKNTTNNNNTSQDTSSSGSTPTSSFMMKEEKDFNNNNNNNNNNNSTMQPYYHHHHHPYPLLPTPSNKPTDYMYNQQHYSNMLQDNSPTPSSRSVLHNNNNNNNNNSISSSSSSSTSSSNKSSTLKGEQKKPHACSHPNCERRFRRLEHLKRHMRIHTHEQPFKCTFPGCLKAFSRSDNLTQHRKTHDRRGSRYQVVDPVVPVTTPSEFMHAPSNAESSFTLVDFIRDGHNNNNYNQHPASPSFDNTNKSHSILGWQHPGDTSTESVGC